MNNFRFSITMKMILPFLKATRSMRITSVILITLLSGVSHSPLYAVDTIDSTVQDDGKITGTVTDPSGETLIGVSVAVKGTTRGTITDIYGKFALSGLKSGDVIEVSFIGMRTETVTISGETDLTIQMKNDAVGLDEVVVTALGIKREKKALGYAVSDIDGQELAKASQINPVNTLQGKSAGVQVSTTAGGTFGGSRITIRGNSTFGSNTQPIFVIDGVVMDNEVSGTSGSDWGNQLKNLNPDDFESFSILKGAAASALYGSRALNGVVMITTKSGSQRKGVGVSFTQTVGIRYIYDEVDFQNEYGSGLTAGGFSGWGAGPNTVQKDDKHDVGQFFTYDKTTGLPSVAFSSGEEHAASWGPKFDGQEIIDYDGSRATWDAQPDNYRDFFDTGVLRNTNIAIDGGSDKGTFRLSFSNFDESGVTPRNDFKKSSFSFKGSQDLIKDKLKIGAVVHYTRSIAENPVSPGENSPWFHDGFPRNYDVNKWRDNYKDIDGGIPYPAGNNYNYTKLSKIWMETYDDENSRVESSFIAKVNLDVAINKNLRASLEGSLNQFTWTGENKTRAKSADRISDASYGISNGEKFQTNVAAKFLYKNEITKDIQMDMILGGELWDTQSVSTSASTNGGFKIRDFYSISNSYNSANASGGISGGKSIYSAYAFINANYKSELYLNTTFRNDWSSSLVYPDGHGNYLYFYPSVSLSWIMNERFTLPSFMSFAKIRASYAVVGNDTDPYKLSTGFVPNNFSDNPDHTMFKYENSQSISPNLKPEKKRSFEAGLDLRFSQGKYSFDIAYYKDNTVNQIIGLPVPQESGLSSQLINAGNLQNSGIEASLNIALVDNRDFAWNIGVNYTRNRDKIIELAPGVNEFNLYGNPSDANSGTASYAYVGGNYGDLVTYKGYKPYDGDNSENKDIPVLKQRNDWTVAYTSGIDNMDSLQVMGNMQPDWLGGLSTDLRYKRVNLGITLDSRFGGEIYSADARYGMHQGVLKSSLANRDAEHGAITWTSNGQGQNFDGKTYTDGYIPTGVFPDGTQISHNENGVRVSKDVGGLTYQQAYDQGLVEPTHYSGFVYRHTSASTGTPLTGVYEQSWIAIREVSLSYSLPKDIIQKLSMTDANISLTGRDLGFLYNSLPDNINPAISNNVASNPLQMRSSPYVRSVTFTLNLKF